MQTLITVAVNSNKGGQVSAAAGVPLHRQLFLVLHDEIDRGVIAAGDPLPTEQTLCEQFGVSRITVRRALADLAEQGYIERKHGVGSFVRRHGPTDVSAGRSYMQGLQQTQFETEVEVVERGVRQPPRGIAELHGGSLSARSDGIGHGSEFILSLPVAQPSADDAPVIAEPVRTNAPAAITSATALLSCDICAASAR